MIDPPPSTSEGRETFEFTVSAGLSVIPVFGGLLQTAWLKSVETEHARRAAAFLQSVYEELARINARLDRTVTVDDLAGNAAVMDALTVATRSAQATSQRRKLQALRNAVVNAALDESPDVEEQARFLRLVDQLQSEHLRLLAILDDPFAALARIGQANPPRPGEDPAWRMLEQFDEFRGQFERYSVLVDDLSREHLLVVNMAETNLYSGQPSQRFTTNLGRRFLTFIGSPLGE